MAGGRDRAALPTGTVTLVLGDVEGSTRLWEEQPEAVAAAVVSLDRVVDDLVGRHGGARPVEQGEGDSFVAAFAGVAEAIGFALDLQRATADGLLRLRLGINTGDVRLRDEGNYAGPTVNRAARVRDAGHGGQVLLSQTAADLAADGLPEGASLEDLGRHRLRDLDRPEHLWQLLHPDLRRDFPPVRVADVVRSNVLAPLTSFVGRSGELAGVAALLDEDRCVTITGAGGCGKTRLATELAVGRRARHPEGVWFVDLAAVDDHDAVAAAVVEAMDLPPGSARSSAARIAHAVGDGAVLLVLDNCEHLVAGCAALVEALLHRCPSLRVLSTSREPLGVAGEVTYRLPSLQPAAARELFVDRARRVDSGFRPTAAELAVIDEVCARLDGIPLAIELAAPRTRVLGVASLLEGLHDRFRLLTGGARGALPRQQTLQASVEWSHDLLLDAERALLRRLAVFADGFTLEAAVAVGAAPPLEPHHVLDLLTQLVDKSLLTRDEDRPGRFRMLETVRQFALARLVDAGEAPDARRRHYDHVVARARPDPREPDRWAAHRARIDADEVDVRRALQWASEQDDPTLLATLCDHLYPYWVTTARAAEGASWTARVRTDDPSDLRLRAVRCTRLGSLHGACGDWERAIRVNEQALDLARAVGDPVLLAEASTTAAMAGVSAAAPDLELATEAVALAHQAGDERVLAFALFGLGLLRTRSGAMEEGQRLLQDSLRRCEAIGYEPVARMARSILATARLLCGEAAGALAPLDAAVEELEAVGQSFHLTNVLAFRAGARAEIGDDAGADRDLDRLQQLAAEIGDPQSASMAGVGLLWVALARGELEALADGLAFVDELPAEIDYRSGLVAIRALARAAAGRLEDAQADVGAIRAGGSGSLGAPHVAAFAEVLIERHRGDDERAWALGRAAVAARPPEVGHPVLDRLLDVLADIGTRLGRFDDAVRLLGAARARAALVGSRPAGGPFEAARRDAEARARASLGHDRVEALLAEGAGLDWAGVAAYLRRGRGGRTRPATGWGSLTPTEGEVVGLVLEGLANKEIAARLFMSLATVKSHLTHAYAKLGVASRSQLAAAARHRDPTSG